MTMRMSVGFGICFLLLATHAWAGGFDFALPKFISIGEGGTNDYAIHDLDGDGDLDFVLQRSATDVSGSVIDLVFNAGDLNFLPPVTLQIPVSSVGRMVVGDLNLDGFPDLVVTEHQSSTVGRVLVLLNDGAGGFPTFQQLPGDDAPSVGLIGDVTGDGRPDLVFNDAVNGSIWMYAQDESGAFLAPEITPGVGTLFSMSLADFDGDGDLDLYGNRLLQYPSAMFVENVNGSLSRIRDIVAHFVDTHTPIADLNNDGLPEVISAKYKKFRVLENHGNFKFSLSNLIDPFGDFDPIGPSVGAGENVGDFDLDGRPDILGRSCDLDLEQNIGFVIITDIEGPSYGLFPDLSDSGTSQGTVDGIELIRFLNDWGPNPSLDVVDLNDDLLVNGLDVARVLANWGPLPERPPFQPHVFPFDEGILCPTRLRAIDLDQDGDDDVITGAQGGFLFFENLLISGSK